MKKSRLWGALCAGILGFNLSPCLSQYTIVDLGTLGGSYSGASVINARGQVIGWSLLGDNSTQHAFLYEAVSMQDLCTLVDCVSAGWDYLENAGAINNKGDITGSGYINGQVHAFLISQKRALKWSDTTRHRVEAEKCHNELSDDNRDEKAAQLHG